MHDPHLAAFALLLVAHLFADFVFQSEALLARKQRTSGLVEHALHHIGTSAAVLLLPLWWGDADLLRAGAVVIALGVTHALIDAAKTRGPAGYRTSALGFITDQGLHGASVYGAALLLSPLGLEIPTGYGRTLLVAGGFVALTRGSMFLVAHLVGPFATPDSGHSGAGRTIGILERIAIALFVWFGQWAAAGFILAAKSLARFKDLDDRRFAEYYLVGTLGSVLAAVGVALIVRALW